MVKKKKKKKLPCFDQSNYRNNRKLHLHSMEHTQSDKYNSKLYIF